MKIEHSDLLHEFITFWFETRVDGKLSYETLLNYNDMRWETNETTAPYRTVLDGNIEISSNENAEEQRIRNIVTEFLKNT